MFRLVFACFATLFSIAATAQSWDLITPINSGRDVRSCSFIDPQTGYIVIEVTGDVYGTKDGGATWFRPWTPGLSGNMYDVEMVSEDVVFVCGSNGDLFRTVDAGSSWVSLDPPTTEWLYALEFVDEMTGYCSGFNGTVLRTTDGGDNWEVLETGTTDRLWDVQFTSPDLGFACGWNGTIIRTQDGGNSWATMDTPYDGALFSCTFPSDQVGYACGWSQTILKTSDGGDTWELQFTNGNQALNFIEFKDEDNGWAAGAWGGYYRTTNGGASWVADDFLSGVEIWGGQYLSDDCAYLTGVGNMYKSSDGGDTWTIIENAVPNAKYNGVYFFDDLHGYACGSVGITGQGSNQAGIVYTENGGDTWEVQAQGFSGGWWDIHFANENEGAVIGGGSYMRTSNGGEDWSGGSFPENLTGVGIHRLNSDEIIAGGDGLFSNICKSDDGGFNWTCGDNLGAKDFFFLDQDEGWAVTEGSTSNIFHTTDGGDSWEYVDTGWGVAKTSLFWLDDQTGWIGTGSGIVLRTTDGGATWESGSLNYDIVGIRFYDALLGFAGDSQGNIWRSEDGGATWDVVLQPSDINMPVVVEVNFTENFAYAGCWSGEIYRAELGCGTIDPPQILAQTEWCEGEVRFVGHESSAVVGDWTWSVPEGWSFTGDFGVIEVTAGSEGGEIGLTIENTCGLTSSSVYAVEVIPAPTPITGLIAPESACENSNLTVMVEDAQFDVTYNWTPPAGWTYLDLGSSAEFTAGETGGTLTVNAENACGVTEPFTLVLEVNPLPTVSLELDADDLCLGTLAVADALPLGGTLEGPGVDGLTVQSTDLEAETVYDYTYAYTDANGCTGSANASLTFLAVPEVSVTFDDLGNCLGATVSPDLVPDGGLLTGAGVTDTAINSEGLEPGTPYAYTYSYTGENGCTATAEASVTFNALPEVSVTFPETGLCISGEVAPELLPAGGTLTGDGAEGAVINTTELTAGDSYAYGYSYTDDNGCSAVTTATVTFNDLPVVSLGFEEDIFCTESTYEAIVSPEGGVFEGPGVGGLLVQSFFLNPGEPYTFNYTYTDENGCAATASQTLEFGQLPYVTLDFDYDVLCVGEQYLATAEPAGGILEGDGVTGTTVDADLLLADVPYGYLYTFTAENGCVNSASVELTFENCLSVKEAETFAFTLYPNPAQDLVTLETGYVVGQQLRILDATGKTVLEQSVEHAITVLDLSDLAQGMYVVWLGDQRGRLVVE